MRDFRDDHYTGPAVKIGAGVHTLQLLTAAAKQGRVVVTGLTGTVGLAGGYTQGGGHSSLSTHFGLAADNTLEFEVVTAAGQLVKASRSENADLYWALSGGGPGNYGVVVSMTIKTHPDTHIGGASLSFSAEGLSSTETFYKAIDAFHAALPEMMTSGGAHVVSYLYPGASFQIPALTAYGKTAEEVEAILAPFRRSLDELQIKYTYSVTHFETFLEHFVAYFGTNDMVGVMQGGSRLVPLSPSVRANEPVNAAMRFINALPVIWIGVSMDVSAFGGDDSNAVLSAWRQGPLTHAVLATPWSEDPDRWDDMLSDQKFLTDTVIPALEAATPGSGAYMNEADFQQPDWQHVFFGKKYDTLLTIKQGWDPEGVFYALNVPGSEAWNVTADGRLCRVYATERPELL